mgnify:CR=1 FL=1
MKKSIIIGIIVLFAIVAGIILVKNNGNKEQKINQEESKEIKNTTQLSGQLVDDECISEWEDYRIYEESKIKESSSVYEKNQKHYLLRKEENIINVYYIDESDNEILYRKTNISTDYLEKDDVEKLENGIDVYGEENLNKVIEDYE